MTAAKPNARLTQERKLLLRLTDSWPRWVSARELATQISLQYNARIFALRRQGWLIVSRVTIVDGIRHGEFRLGTAPIPSGKELRARKEVPAAESSLFGDISPDRTYSE